MPRGRLRTLCVFCGSAVGTRPSYREAAEHLAAELAARRMELVYGGGNVGLMGVVADAALAHGVRVTGVIPDGLAERELAHHGLGHQVELFDALVHAPGQGPAIERHHGVVGLVGFRRQRRHGVSAFLGHRFW